MTYPTIPQILEWLDNIWNFNFPKAEGRNAVMLKAIRDHLSASLPHEGMKSAEEWEKKISNCVSECARASERDENMPSSIGIKEIIRAIQADALASRAAEPIDDETMGCSGCGKRILPTQQYEYQGEYGCAECYIQCLLDDIKDLKEELEKSDTAPPPLKEGELAEDELRERVAVTLKALFPNEAWDAYVRSAVCIIHEVRRK